MTQGFTTLQKIAAAINAAGTITVFWVATLSFVLILLVFEKYDDAILFSVALIAFGASVGLLKLVTNVPRPPDRLVEAELDSFPSGHAGGATLFAVMASFVTGSHLGFNDTAPLAFILMFWAILVSWSRLELKVHRPVEVAAGVLLALTISFLVITFQDPLTAWGLTFLGPVLGV